MSPSAATASRRIVRFTSERRERTQDVLAVEEPLEIRVNGRSLLVTMRTPGDDPELAAGLLFSEGIIASTAGITRCSVHPRSREGNLLDVTLADATAVDWDRLKRRFAGTSSCGLCGRESIQAIRRRLRRIKSDIRVSPGLLLQLPERLLEEQPAFGVTGGLHAAALFDARGRLLVAREDIGRHNAVDKAVGWALLQGRLPLSRHLLLVSGRASFEIVQKALAAEVPILCAVSAPSSLAVELAQSGGQTLVGYLRKDRLNVYTRVGRVRHR